MANFNHSFLFLYWSLQMMLPVLLMLTLCITQSFSATFCEIYFRKICKARCESYEVQLASNVYCGTSTTGSACCVLSGNPPPSTTTSPPPPTTTSPPPPPPPTDGWTMWSSWGACTGSCVYAYQYRFRACQSTTPCVGEPVVVRNCIPESCGGGGFTTTPTTTTVPPLSEWSAWSACSTSCGPGNRFRNRYCTRPEGCGSEPLTETESCDYGACPMWNLWSMWSECSASCDGGMRARRRECIDPSTFQPVTIDRCEGSDTETQMCNENICPDNECGTSGTAPRILGGGDASQCQWPWMVHIKIPAFPISSGNTNTACSGVLVDKNSVVTTASCAEIVSALDAGNNKATIIAADFDSTTTDGGVDVYLTDIVQHPDYVGGSTDLELAQFETNNLAIIQLDTEIQKDSCKNYVCLPDAYRNASQQSCVMAGWGLTAPGGSHSPILQQTTANIQDMSLCKFYYQWQPGYPSDPLFEENFVCGSTPSFPTLPCTGDEGGMLVCPDTSTGVFQWTLAGLSKPASCDATKPTLFVSVTSKIDWIRETMKLND